jgi:hypothetical protein
VGSVRPLVKEGQTVNKVGQQLLTAAAVTTAAAWLLQHTHALHWPHLFAKKSSSMCEVPSRSLCPCFPQWQQAPGYIPHGPRARTLCALVRLPSPMPLPTLIHLAMYTYPLMPAAGRRGGCVQVWYTFPARSHALQCTLIPHTTCLSPTMHTQPPHGCCRAMRWLCLGLVAASWPPSLATGPLPLMTTWSHTAGTTQRHWSHWGAAWVGAQE